jgi:glutamate N-acetyltransferase/amino-acid N-acetyltransferase
MAQDIHIPNGFRFSGLHCGIKPERLDLGLVVADRPANAFGVYTRNLVRAACIDWNRSITPGRGIRGVVVNSGNANACTGATGVKNNEQMAQLAAESLSQGGVNTRADQMLVLSTGVIGWPLPMSKLESGIPQAVSRLGHGQEDFRLASAAMLTTDRNQKIASGQITVDQQTFRIAAMAKGAGMIGPNMATMLAVIVSDFPVPFDTGQGILQRVADLSFNRISVEGHTSTNDSMLLFTPAGDAPNTAAAIETFERELTRYCIELARMIPTDGEGAEHLIEIHIRGTETVAAAETIARTIAMSNLVKTAVAGGDPNWGRIVSAAGYSGVEFDVAQTSLVLNGFPVFRNGTPIPFDKKVVSNSIKSTPTTQVDLTVGEGPCEAMHWTSDLTVDYVRLNSEYTT